MSFKKVDQPTNPTPEQRENIRTWIAALRSGEYEQGEAYLQTLDGKFCCLGVACDLFDPDGWNRSERLGCVLHGHMSALPNPSQMEEWFGVRTNSPTVDGVDFESTLAGLNDNRVPFKEIADRIEASWL